MQSQNLQKLVIRFFCNVDDISTRQLMDAIQMYSKKGVSEFILLISSGGGSVHHGLSAYNLLKGMPQTIITHSFGSANSSACLIFCAGNKRYSVSNSNFLIHNVRHNLMKSQNMTEKDLEETINNLKQDTRNIAGVLAETSGKSQEELLQKMEERTVLSSKDALEFGLVHEIKEKLFEGVPVISISDRSNMQPGFPMSAPR